MATPIPGFGGGGWAALLPLPILSSLMGVQTWRAPWADCREPASLEVACRESAHLEAAFLSMAAFWQSAVQPAGHQKAALHLDALRGAAGPMS